MTSSQAQSSGGPGAVRGGSEQVEAPEPDAGPGIQILGDATPEQVAALVAVLSAASGGAGTEVATRHTSAWSAPAATVRRPLAPGGPGAWQRSLRS